VTAAIDILGGGWPLWTAAALLGAWLTLDETSWGQTWLSQPLPAALLAGLATGDMTAGLLIGLPFQLATLGNLPVGQSFLGDKPGPVIGVVFAVSGNLAPSGTLPWTMDGATASGVGWLLVLLAVASIMGNSVVMLERKLRVRWSAGTLRSLRDGRTGRLDAAQRRSMVLTAVRGAASTLIWGGVATSYGLAAVAQMPNCLAEAMAVLPALCPALAVGALVELYGSRRGLRWLGAAFLGSLAVAWVIALRGGGAA